MVKHVLFLLFICVFTNTSWAVSFDASVDRTTIGEGESLLLTVRYNSNVLSGEPNFSALRQQFEIINQQRKNSFEYINGQSNSWTIWTLTLTPKRKGNLIIPSIEYRGEKTKPIQIQVTKVNPNIAKQDKDVFFHTEVDTKTAYVQGQVVYTEKLYFSVPLGNHDLSSVAVEDAVLQLLGDTRQYRTQLNGRNFEVFERRYVIFPQASGEIIIPGPRYSGQIDNGPWRAGRPVSVSHPPIRVQVLPQPANYPQQATWLPANDLQLTSKWLGNTQQVKVGDPITLSITLKADGLSAAQLPSIELAEMNGLKYYPEKPQKNETYSDSGITGWQTVNIAVVATQSGSITIPEIRIPWFNIKHSRVEYVSLKPQTLQVIASSLPKSNQAPQPPAMKSTLPTSTEDSYDSTPEPSAQTANFWPVVSLIFMLLWLATSYLLWRQSKQAPKVTDTSNIKSPNIKAQLKAIKQACRNNDAKQARQAIIDWAQNFDHVRVHSLMDVSLLSPAPEFKQALQELDYTLYSENGNSAWQGEYLWQMIRHINPNQDKPTSAELQPLYPN